MTRNLSAYSIPELFDCGDLGSHPATAYYTYVPFVAYGERSYTVSVHNVVVHLSIGAQSKDIIATSVISPARLSALEDEIADKLKDAQYALEGA